MEMDKGRIHQSSFILILTMVAGILVLLFDRISFIDPLRPNYASGGMSLMHVRM
jgi:hypothetical protein